MVLGFSTFFDNVAHITKKLYYVGSKISAAFLEYKNITTY